MADKKRRPKKRFRSQISSKKYPLDQLFEQETSDGRTYIRCGSCGETKKRWLEGRKPGPKYRTAMRNKVYHVDRLAIIRQRAQREMAQLVYEELEKANWYLYRAACNLGTNETNVRRIVKANPELEQIVKEKRAGRPNKGRPKKDGTERLVKKRYRVKKKDP